MTTRITQAQLDKARTKLSQEAAIIKLSFALPLVAGGAIGAGAGALRDDSTALRGAQTGVGTGLGMVGGNLTGRAIGSILSQLIARKLGPTRAIAPRAALEVGSALGGEIAGGAAGYNLAKAAPPVLTNKTSSLMSLPRMQNAMTAGALAGGVAGSSKPGGPNLKDVATGASTGAGALTGHATGALAGRVIAKLLGRRLTRGATGASDIAARVGRLGLGSELAGTAAGGLAGYSAMNPPAFLSRKVAPTA